MFTHIAAISGFLQLLLVNLTFHLISFLFSLKNFFFLLLLMFEFAGDKLFEFLFIWKCLEFPLLCAGYLSWVYSSCLLVSFLLSLLLPSFPLPVPPFLHTFILILTFFLLLFPFIYHTLSTSPIPLISFNLCFSASCLWCV